MKKTIYSVLILAFLGIAFYFLVGSNNQAPIKEPTTQNEELSTYKSSEYSPEFTHPASWGDVTLKAGNKICPEEDTYRTPDSLHIFDWEYSFAEMRLPGSDSIIRTGIRTYELDPKNPNDCGSDFHLKIAQKEVDPETISSFRLSRVAVRSGLEGTINQEASRLNTEARIQYTFYTKNNSNIFILQPYWSFIPFFGSPELEELEQKFKGDMQKYLTEGATAGVIRNHINKFRNLVESLKFKGE